jgi:hypothetical protein
VHLGQRLGQVAIALIGDDDRCAGLGDQQVGAGDADIGLEIFLAQHLARFAEQRAGSERSRSLARCVCTRGSVLDLLTCDMHRRRDDVARMFAAQLDDVFAEIGLDRLDAVGREVVVERDLLGDHRLALVHRLGAGLRQMSSTIFGRPRRLGPVHMAAGGFAPWLVASR